MIEQVTETLTTAQWLWLMVAAVLTFFGVAWSRAALRLFVFSRALFDYAAFNLASGCGLLLVGLAGQMPKLLSETVANLAILAGFFFLWRGGNRLYGFDLSMREAMSVVLLAACAIVYFGIADDTGQLRVASLFMAIAWIAARASWSAYRNLRQSRRWQFGLLLLTVGCSISFVFGARALQGIAGIGSIAFEANNPANIVLAFLMLFSVFAVNALIAFLVVDDTQGRLIWLSSRDALTGLCNHRATMALVDSSWERFLRNREPLSVLCIDVDLFKVVNDHYGHATGDRVLKAVSATIGQSIRMVDHLGRVGGEEFLVVLPGTTLEDATEIAERVRTRVEETVRLDDLPELRITVSVGVVEADVDDVSRERLLSRGDRILYAAKSAGRNRVAVDRHRTQDFRRDYEIENA